MTTSRLGATALLSGIGATPPACSAPAAPGSTVAVTSATEKVNTGAAWRIRRSIPERLGASSAMLPYWNSARACQLYLLTRQQQDIPDNKTRIVGDDAVSATPCPSAQTDDQGDDDMVPLLRYPAIRLTARPTI
jgi:hypothetical protein